MARKEHQDRERRDHAAFTIHGSEERYRVWFQELRPLWTKWNTEFFDGRLKEPHILIGRTAPRSLGHCSPMTGYGAPAEITLNERLMFPAEMDEQREWIVNPWSPGHRLFVVDLLLRLTVQQYVLEELGADEASYRGYGPLFTEQANRVGLKLDLAPVIVRRRGVEDSNRPVASGWPFCVRAEGYYGDDVTERLSEFAIGTSGTRAPGATVPPSQGIWEMVLFFLAANKTDDLRQMAAAYLDRLQAVGPNAPVLARFERGAEDEDGEPFVGEVDFDSTWLQWNGGTVRNLAHAIHAFRAYAELPILADALEEAGCADGRILRHLRARTKGHDSRCWVLKRLLA
jgi:hypothetical protein